MKWTEEWLSYLGGFRLEFGGGGSPPAPPPKTELQKKQEQRSLDEMKKTDKQIAAREESTKRSYAGRASLISNERDIPDLGIPRRRRKAQTGTVPENQKLG